MKSLIQPNWPAPERIKAYSSTRLGGVSQGAYASLNLGDHVNDVPDNVEQNRQRFKTLTGLPTDPVWLEQVHGVDVLTLAGQSLTERKFDAAYSHLPEQACVVMTADCLPVLFCSTQGNEVAAAHAGWRSLCYGVLENTVRCFYSKPQQIMAWLGPAIGPQCFEVGAEVREAFMQHNINADAAFKLQANGKYLADIYLLARQRLNALGVTQVYGGEYCTVSDKEHFFSYRRDKQTGRMASVIWIES